MVVGAVGTRQSFLRLAALVEPFRDELVELPVSGALHRSTQPGSTADTGGVARLTHHVEIVREAYASVLMVVQGFLVGAASAVLGLSTLVPAALVLVLPPLVGSLLLFAVVLLRTAPLQRDSILANERIAETATATANGLRDVTACGGEDAVVATVGHHIDEQARTMRQLGRFSAARSLTVAIGGMLPVVLVLFHGRWLLRNGASTGAVLGCITYVLYGVQPALQALVRQVGNTGLWLFVAADRIVEASVAEQGTDEHDDRPSSIPAGHDVHLDHVTFRYGPRPEPAGSGGVAQPVLQDLDLSIPHDHLVVVGPSGIGKSTLAGLIAGVYRPEAGVVRVGGQPLRDLDPRVLAGVRVLIPQEAYVSAGTLRENLAYLSSSWSHRQLIEAVDALGMRSLAVRLGGFDVPIDAMSLSAGERQHITLVRAYLSSAPIVLLDEASCHLDPSTEALIEHAFARTGRTLVVIAHRISSALRGRRVLVMDGAEVLVGTHDDLQERSPLYRDLIGRWSGDATPEHLPA